MAKEKENTGAQNAIVPADKRQLQRQPDESEKAHRARVAYCKLAPSQRTIAAAYRVFKDMEPDAEVKVPGYFGAWAKRFRWKEYAIAWDAYFNDIVATRRDEQMAAAMEIRLEKVKLTSVLNCGTPLEAGHSVRLGLKTDCATRVQPQIRYALCPYMLTLTG